MQQADVGEVLYNQPSLLLRAVAEELKLPLLHIARTAELARQTRGVDYQHIQTSADMALLLVDNYLLGLELNEAQLQFELTPVSVSSILNDTAHTLNNFAKQYDMTLELATSGKYGPVFAHAAGLKAALISLGYALLSVPPADGTRRTLTLGVHQSSRGLVAGVYGDFAALAQSHLRQARLLCGRARQPLSSFSSTSTAGVFVADLIFQAMQSSLSVSRHQKRTGLAGTLQPSRQLALV